MSKQLLLGSNNQALVLGAGNTRYTALNGDCSWTTNESNTTKLVPTDCVISEFRVHITSAPGVGKSWTFTLRKNEADTLLAVTISGTDTNGADMTHKVRLAPTDKVGIKCVANDSGLPTSYGSWSLMSESDCPLENWWGANGTNLSGTNVRYYNVNATLSGGDIGFNVPLRGVAKKMYVELSAAPGAGKSVTFTLTNDSVATSVEVVISDAETSGSDLTHTATFDLGETLTVKSTPAGSPDTFTTAKVSIVYELEHEGYSLIAGLNPSQVTGSCYMNFARVCDTATESTIYAPMRKARLLGFTMRMNTVPGAGKSYTFTTRNNGVNTDVALTLSDAESEGYVFDKYHNFTIDDLITMYVTATNSPNAMYHYFCALFYIDPTMTTVNKLGCGHDARIPHADNGVGLLRHPRSRVH